MRKIRPLNIVVIIISIFMSKFVCSEPTKSFFDNDYKIYIEDRLFKNKNIYYGILKVRQLQTIDNILFFQYKIICTIKNTNNNIEMIPFFPGDNHDLNITTNIKNKQQEEVHIVIGFHNIKNLKDLKKESVVDTTKIRKCCEKNGVRNRSIKNIIDQFLDKVQYKRIYSYRIPISSGIFNQINFKKSNQSVKMLYIISNANSLPEQTDNIFKEMTCEAISDTDNTNILNQTVYNSQTFAALEKELSVKEYDLILLQTNKRDNQTNDNMDIELTIYCDFIESLSCSSRRKNENITIASKKIYLSSNENIECDFQDKHYTSNNRANIIDEKSQVIVAFFANNLISDGFEVNLLDDKTKNKIEDAKISIMFNGKMIYNKSNLTKFKMYLIKEIEYKMKIQKEGYTDKNIDLTYNHLKEGKITIELSKENTRTVKINCKVDNCGILEDCDRLKKYDNDFKLQIQMKDELRPCINNEFVKINIDKLIGIELPSIIQKNYTISNYTFKNEDQEYPDLAITIQRKLKKKNYTINIKNPLNIKAEIPFQYTHINYCGKTIKNDKTIVRTNNQSQANFKFNIDIPTKLFKNEKNRIQIENSFEYYLSINNDGILSNLNKNMIEIDPDHIKELYLLKRSKDEKILVKLYIENKCIPNDVYNISQFEIGVKTYEFNREISIDTSLLTQLKLKKSDNKLFQIVNKSFSEDNEKHFIVSIQRKLKKNKYTININNTLDIKAKIPFQYTLINYCGKNVKSGEKIVNTINQSQDTFKFYIDTPTELLKNEKKNRLQIGANCEYYFSEKRDAILSDSNRTILDITIDNIKSIYILKKEKEKRIVVHLEIENTCYPNNVHNISQFEINDITYNFNNEISIYPALLTQLTLTRTDSELFQIENKYFSAENDKQYFVKIKRKVESKVISTCIVAVEITQPVPVNYELTSHCDNDAITGSFTISSESNNYTLRSISVPSDNTQVTLSITKPKGYDISNTNNISEMWQQDTQAYNIKKQNLNLYLTKLDSYKIFYFDIIYDKSVKKRTIFHIINDQLSNSNEAFVVISNGQNYFKTAFTTQEKQNITDRFSSIDPIIASNFNQDMKKIYQVLISDNLYFQYLDRKHIYFYAIISSPTMNQILSRCIFDIYDRVPKFDKIVFYVYAQYLDKININRKACSNEIHYSKTDGEIVLRYFDQSSKIVIKSYSESTNFINR